MPGARQAHTATKADSPSAVTSMIRGRPVARLPSKTCIATSSTIASANAAWRTPASASTNRNDPIPKTRDTTTVYAMK